MMDPQPILSTRSIVKRRIRTFFNDRWVTLAAVWLGFWLIMALLAPILSNDKPLYCKIHNQSFFPIFQHTANRITITILADSTYKLPQLGKDWKDISYQFVIWPLISHGPSLNPRIKSAQPPFAQQYIKDHQGNEVNLPLKDRHWLGTTHDNRDLLAVLIHGSRRAFFFSILATMLASVIGIFLGSMSGFLGDRELKVKRSTVLFFFSSSIFAFFYGWYIRWYILIDSWSQSYFLFFFHFFISVSISIVIVLSSLRLSTLFKGWVWIDRSIYIPIDQIVLRIIEITRSIPILILLIIIGSLVGANLWIFTLLSSLIAWPSFARLMRSEMLQVKSAPYIQSGKILGYSRMYILFKHALPNALPNMWVIVFLVIGRFILLEASISFLGIGLSSDIPSWGEIIFSAKQQNMSLWWMAVFPGLVLTLTVLSFNIWGERLRDLYDPYKII